MTPGEEWIRSFGYRKTPLGDWSRENGNKMEYLSQGQALFFYRICQKAERDTLLELRGWIALNHLGEGFDGDDRWEHCAAEITQHIHDEVEARVQTPNQGKES